MKTDNIVVRLARTIGMDGAIAYSSASRIFQAFAGIISLFFIANFLTGSEQGYYYTFCSILAIQIFFELGFTDVMTQYVAHEVAHLKIDSSFFYKGDARFRSRLASLVRFCIKWYFIISLAFFIVVNIIGFVFFNKFGSDATVSWKIPWLILSFSTAIKLFQAPFTAIYTGLGWVKEMSKISFYQQLILPLSQWVLFALGFKLYVVGLSSLFGVIIWFYFIYRSKLKIILLNLLQEQIVEKVNYLKEIFPYQWRIALSWVSGFFIFQLFNPVLFATEGAIVAGQMGMTLNVLNAIQALVRSWQTTKVPLYSGLIELRKYHELDTIFIKTTHQVMYICTSLLVIMVLGVQLLIITHWGINGNELGSRFLKMTPMLILFVPFWINQLVSSWATYLRCHKQEPYLIVSVIGAILQSISLFFFGRIYGLNGVVIGNLIVTLITFPLSYFIYRRKKHEWHDSYEIVNN